jgi:hypothetical protein
MPKDDSAYQGSQKPTLAEFGRVLERNIELGLWTSLPAKVVAFAPALPPTPPTFPGGKPATVMVQPSLMLVHRSPSGDELPPKPMPQIPAAILGMFACGGFRMTATPQPGDDGWVFISARSLEQWRKSGGAPIDPGFAHTHNLADSLWVPIGKPAPEGLTVDPAGLSISTDTGSPLEPGQFLMDVAGNVTIEGPTIRIGRLAASPAVLGTELMVAIAAMLAAGVGAATVEAAAFTAMQVAWQTSIASATPLSTKVLLE